MCKKLFKIIALITTLGLSYSQSAPAGRLVDETDPKILYRKLSTIGQTVLSPECHERFVDMLKNSDPSCFRDMRGTELEGSDSEWRNLFQHLDETDKDADTYESPIGRMIGGLCDSLTPQVTLDPSTSANFTCAIISAINPGCNTEEIRQRILSHHHQQAAAATEAAAPPSSEDITRTARYGFFKVGLGLLHMIRPSEDTQQFTAFDTILRGMNTLAEDAEKNGPRSIRIIAGTDTAEADEASSDKPSPDEISAYFSLQRARYVCGLQCLRYLSSESHGVGGTISTVLGAASKAAYGGILEGRLAEPREDLQAFVRQVMQNPHYIGAFESTCRAIEDILTQHMSDIRTRLPHLDERARQHAIESLRTFVDGYIHNLTTRYLMGFFSADKDVGVSDVVVPSILKTKTTANRLHAQVIALFSHSLSEEARREFTRTYLEGTRMLTNLRECFGDEDTPNYDHWLWGELILPGSYGHPILEEVRQKREEAGSGDCP